MNIPDLPTPISSQGGYGNAMGAFHLDRSLQRKVKSRKDLSQPKPKPERVSTDRDGEENTDEEMPFFEGLGDYRTDDDAMSRYYGAFSVESKRHVWDLLKKHPEFGSESGVRLNRIRNNTTEVLSNDPIKNITNGGYVVYEKSPYP
jgi:hypothetical protein